MLSQRGYVGGSGIAGVGYHKALLGIYLCAPDAVAFQPGMFDKPPGRDFHPVVVHAV